MSAHEHRSIHIQKSERKGLRRREIWRWRFSRSVWGHTSLRVDALKRTKSQHLRIPHWVLLECLDFVPRSGEGYLASREDRCKL